MFQEITLINYARPLKLRAEMRRSVGPYRWRPAQPMTGRGFYQAGARGLECDARGSTFNLRLIWANDLLSDCGYGSLTRVNGYYCDEFGDQTLRPIVARLPHSRGFLAGWTMGQGMAATLDATIYEDAEDAARAAHSLAESDAEAELESQTSGDLDE